MPSGVALKTSLRSVYSSMARRSSSSVASLIIVLIVKTLAFVAPAVVILEPDLSHPLRGDAQQEGDVAHRDTGGTTQRNVTAGSGADLGLQRLSAGAGRTHLGCSFLGPAGRVTARRLRPGPLIRRR